jgi:hypothetical protein
MTGRVFAVAGSPQLDEASRHALCEEVIQHLHDTIATVTRRVKQLAGFARVALEAGETVVVSFDVHADRTAFVGRELQRLVEPGQVEVLIVAPATDPPCRGRVRLAGPVRAVDHDRRLVTPLDMRAAGRE